MHMAEHANVHACMVRRAVIGTQMTRRIQVIVWCGGGLHASDRGAGGLHVAGGPCLRHAGTASLACRAWGMQVWHNYGFDKHILQRRGLGIPEPQLRQHGKDPEQLSLSLGGFAGDTMHMARLHDAARKGTKTYSLASLTSDKTVMCAPDRSVLTRSKISLKELFARPKISKSGKPSASLKELPPIHELQVRPWHAVLVLRKTDLTRAADPSSAA